ncbi:helitron helicase-like domain-containing protein [Artemisia annua]|uniref:Helitron helicase-like domain-containing protein n=1 Tax=Artemisia annua TaxID=35608 RepID=A0A2U1MVB0_ARTAN|nr:helitron helicase-like domain-containing protein [Artemisia annua]
MKTKQKAVRRIPSLSNLDHADLSPDVAPICSTSESPKRNHALCEHICVTTSSANCNNKKYRRLNIDPSSLSVFSQCDDALSTIQGQGTYGSHITHLHMANITECVDGTFTSDARHVERQQIATNRRQTVCHTTVIPMLIAADKSSSAAFSENLDRNRKRQRRISAKSLPTQTQNINPNNRAGNSNRHSKRPRFIQVTSNGLGASGNLPHTNSNQHRRLRQGILCCNNGKVVLPPNEGYPDYIKDLFRDRHYMENIRAYNQMFAMTSLGVEVDNSINTGRGPYIFKVSGKIYHWIGSMCPELNKEPKFLQLYIYDTANEIDHRLGHFKNTNNRLRRDIVQNLVQLLDEHNRLVKLFRTTRDKIETADIPDFKLKLFGVVGSRQYDLPTGDSVGAIVFEGGPEVATDYDVIIKKRGGQPQRIDKLNPHYMSLHFPLFFIHGEEGYHLGLKLLDKAGEPAEKDKQMSMKMYYAYELHDRFQQYSSVDAI